MSKEGFSPFLSSALTAKDLNVQFLEGPAYFDHRMSLEEANELSWSEFKSRLQPFSILKKFDNGTEFVLSPKSPPWTYKDFTVFAGDNNRKIATIRDLDDSEGQAFLDINFRLAKEILSDYEHDEVHFAIGFNESDYIPGQHHSINTRLHSHIYVADSPVIRESLVPQKWEEFSWVDRLRFMEPTISIAQDLLRKLIEEKLFSEHLKNSEVFLNSGYISVDLNGNTEFTSIFSKLKSFFIVASQEYDAIESIITDKTVDLETGRYLPREKSERVQMMEAYICKNREWLSNKSVSILRYLASRIVRAGKRSNQDYSINNANQVWATKGFAGAVNFSLRKDRKSIRMDFLPCIFSTSSMNKVLVAQEFPTLLRRAKMGATEEQKQVMNMFYQEMIDQLPELFPDYERVL